MNERGLRARLVAAARRLSTLGLNRGKSGNVSLRAGDGFLITPSGKDYESIGIDDMVRVEGDGNWDSSRKPSSEWQLHRDIYARHEYAGAVVHTHSSYATTLACLGRGIPSFHYEVAFAGGNDIRCAPYFTFGTQELSSAALAALEGRRACLLANHGVVVYGIDLDAAMLLAEKVEDLARLYWQALQVGEPKLLDDAEMARVVAKFSTYGRA